MLIDIDKIVVNNRIRHEYGDLEELAEDIKTNGLINPPVVNKAYELLAGERRLRACKLLGWPTIEVRMMDTRDAEHELNIEISENDVRKGFTKSERVDYMKRLLRIEQAKAKERQGERTSDRNLTEVQRSDVATAEQFGISRDTMRREIEIADNRDLLDPADFADWDEGKLSTNKAFQRIKAAMAQAERERDEARKDAEEVSELYGKTVVQRDQAESERKRIERELRKASITQTNLEMEAESLRQQLAQRPDPEVIEREVEVVREVVPEDVQKRIRDLEHEQRIYLDTDRKLRDQLQDVRKELDRAKGIIGMDKGTRDVQRDVEYLISATNQYVRHYGGLTWTFERIADVDDVTRDELRKAVKNLATFSSALVASLEQMQ